MPTVLHNRILGIPVWVWGAALAGGIVAGIYLRRRSQANAAVGGDTLPDVGTDAAGNDTSGVNDTGLPDSSFGPVGGSGGFNEAPPPDGSTGFNINGHLDPAIVAAINAQTDKRFKRDDKREDKKEHHKRRPPHKSDNPNRSGGKSATTHFPTPTVPSPSGVPR
jgi:hypothetical protein